MVERDTGCMWYGDPHMKESHALTCTYIHVWIKPCAVPHIHAHAHAHAHAHTHADPPPMHTDHM